MQCIAVCMLYAVRTHAGHLNQESGFAFHANWNSEHRDLHGFNWFISMDTKGSYRTNGRNRTTQGCTQGIDCTPIPLSINHHGINTQSDFMIAEALVYGGELSLSQIWEVESWLNFKYGIVADIRKSLL